MHISPLKNGVRFVGGRESKVEGGGCEKENYIFF